MSFLVKVLKKGAKAGKKDFTIRAKQRSVAIRRGARKMGMAHSTSAERVFARGKTTVGVAKETVKSQNIHVPRFHRKSKVNDATKIRINTQLVKVERPRSDVIDVKARELKVQGRGGKTSDGRDDIFIDLTQKRVSGKIIKHKQLNASVNKQPSIETANRPSLTSRKQVTAWYEPKRLKAWYE